MLLLGSKNIEIRKYLPNIKKGDIVYFYDNKSKKPFILGFGIVEFYFMGLFQFSNKKELKNNIKQIQKQGKTGLNDDWLLKYIKPYKWDLNIEFFNLKFIRFSKIDKKLTNAPESNSKTILLDNFIKNENWKLQKYIIVER